MSKEAVQSKDEAAEALPHDALVIKDLLASMGVTEYEPRVVQLLLNCMYRHVSDILQDAEAFRQKPANSSGEISMEDLLLAIQARESYSFVQPPPQSVISELAAKQNKQPLPELSDKPGLQIPVNSLTGPSYQLTVQSEDLLAKSQSDETEHQHGSSLRGGSKQKPAQLQINVTQQKPSENESMDAG